MIFVFLKIHSIHEVFIYLSDSQSDADSTNPQQILQQKELDGPDTTLRRSTQTQNTASFVHRNWMWMWTWNEISQQTFVRTLSLSWPQPGLFSTQQESGTASWFSQPTLLDQSSGPSAPQHLNCNTIEEECTKAASGDLSLYGALWNQSSLHTRKQTDFWLLTDKLHRELRDSWRLTAYSISWPLG